MSSLCIIERFLTFLTFVVMKNPRVLRCTIVKKKRDKNSYVASTENCRGRMNVSTNKQTNCNLLFERNQLTYALFWHLYGMDIASNLIYRYVMIGKQSGTSIPSRSSKSVILVCARVSKFEQCLEYVISNIRCLKIAKIVFDETRSCFENNWYRG